MNNLRTLTKTPIKELFTLDRVIWFLTVVLLACFRILDTFAYVSYVLIAITLVIFALTLVRDKFVLHIHIGPFHGLILAFVVYSFLTAIWARSSSVALEKGLTVFEIFVCMAVLYLHYQRFSEATHLVRALKWSGYIVVFYTFLYFRSQVFVVLFSGSRLPNAFVNINSVGLAAALSIIIELYDALFKKATWSLALIAPALIMLFACGTRKALFLLVIGALLIVFLRFKRKTVGANLLILAALVGAVVLICLLLALIPFFSGIFERLQALVLAIFGDEGADGSTLQRFDMIRVGWEQFLKSPIIGIGMGNSSLVLEEALDKATYTHNNFVEMLVNGGVFAFFLYYALYGYVLYTLFRYRKQGKPLVFLCITLALLLLVMDFGQVSYTEKITYFYFMILFLQCKGMKKRALEMKNS